MSAIWNPYLEAAAVHLGDFGFSAQAAMKALRLEFAWAIPDQAAAETILRYAPIGAVEIGAGSGYWRRYFEQFGVALLSYDIGGDVLARWSKKSWSEVGIGGPELASSRPDLPLLLVKPNDVPAPEELPGQPTQVSYAAEAFSRYREAGGKTLIHVGLPYYHEEQQQPPGLSAEQRVLGYTYVPDLLNFPQEWKLVNAVPIPTYDHTGWGPEHVYVLERR